MFHGMLCRLPLKRLPVIVGDNFVNTAEKSLRHIWQRIEGACERCGRNPAEITLIGASKTVSVARLQEFSAAGLRDFGENYVQEAAHKMTEMSQVEALSSTRNHERALQWHFIGALQSNKAREVVGRFALIHSVDRTSLAQALNKEAQSQNVVQRVLLQVNIGDEANKAGCDINELPDLWKFCAELPNLEVRGLMCLPPANDDAEQSRPYFRRLRELRDELNQSSTRKGSFEISELSMGMTNDFEIALEEGATMIRIGTGLFGERS